MNLSEFTSELKGGARANQYKVTIPFPVFAGGAVETRKLSFLCKAAQLPGDTIGVIEAFFRGKAAKIPGDRTDAEWTITVFNDAEMVVRTAFEKWSNGCRNNTTSNGLPVEEVLSDATVEQLDVAGNAVKTYTLRGVWPSEVAAVDLAYDTNDTISEFTVTLQLQWKESDSTS